MDRLKGQVVTVDGGLNSHVSTVGEFKNMRGIAI